MIGRATFPGGFTLEPATQADIDLVEANFRAGDRREHEIEGGERTRLDEFEQCWTVRAANGDVIGYFGVLVVPNESFMSRTRGFCFMSCENANRHKIAFVKASRHVFRWMVYQCPAWTDRFVTWPLESYAASVRWQRRVLRMRPVRLMPAPKGERYLIMEISRKEVMSWR